MNSEVVSSHLGFGLRMNDIDLIRCWETQRYDVFEIVRIDGRIRLDGTGFLMRLVSY